MFSRLIIIVFAYLVASPVFPAGVEETNVDQFLTKGLRAVFEVPHLNPSRRSPPEVFNVSRGTLQVQLYRPFKRKTDEQKRACEAFELLHFGRGKMGKGAKEAFFRFPELKSIVLTFYDIDRTHKPISRKQGTGPITYKTETRLLPYLSVSLTRETLAKIQFPQRSELQKTNTACLNAGTKWATNLVTRFRQF